MSEIEKMKRYIKRTGMKKFDNYALIFGEVSELIRSCIDYNSSVDALILAFNYGKAKGYRKARAEAKAEVRS